MSTYEANRLSQGNSLFPAKIVLKDDSVVLKIPGLFDGKEKSLLYRQITSIEINGGMLSFCDITIKTSRSGKIIAKGFSHSTAKEIQSAINYRINNPISNVSKSKNRNNQNSINEDELWAEMDAIHKDSKNSLLEIYEEELKDIRKYYDLDYKSKNGGLDEKQKIEYELLGISTDNGIPSAPFRFELDERGIEFTDLFESELGLKQYLNSNNKKSIQNLNNKSNSSNKTDEDLVFLKKYWLHIVIGFAIIILLFTFLKSRENNKKEAAIEIHQKLESKAIDISKLIIEKKYDKALDEVKNINHPNHILMDNRSSLLNNYYYDTYWSNYKDSIVTLLMKKIKKK